MEEWVVFWVVNDYGWTNSTVVYDEEQLNEVLASLNDRGYRVYYQRIVK
jgi:hypothetical protein